MNDTVSLTIKRTVPTLPGLDSGTSTDKATGNGVAAGGKAVLPDAAGTTAGGSLASVAAHVSALYDSLDAIFDSGVEGDSDTALLEAMNKLNELQSELGKTKIELDSATKRAAIAERQAQLEEAQRKMEEAKKQQENLSIWDKIKLAFMFIGAALAMVGAALIGGPAGVLMGVAAFAMVISAVDASVKQASPDGLGIAGSIAKAGGKSTEDAKKADETFGYAMMGITVAFSVAGMLASALPSLINVLSKVAPTIAASVQEATQVSATVSMSFMEKMTMLASAGVTVSSGIGDGVVSGLEYDATMKETDAKDLQAKAKSLEAMIQQINDMIDQTMTRLRGLLDGYNSMVDTQIDALNDVANSVSSVKYSV